METRSDRRELIAVVKDAGLTGPGAQSLIEAFGPDFEAAHKLCVEAAQITVTDAAQADAIERSRVLRVDLGKIRRASEKRRKELKEDSLRTGQAIDKVAKVVALMTETAEAKMLENEKFVERAEAARKEALRVARAAQLAPLGADPALYKLEEMTDAAFSQLVDGLRRAKEAKEEADRKAEEERVAREKADREERERVAAENARLRAEAEAREKEMRAERERLEAEAAEERRKAKAEADAAAEKARQEREALEAKARQEREARERLEAQERARQAEADRKAAEADRAARAAALAPDREKIAALATAVREIRMPDVGFTLAKAAVQEIEAKVESFAKWIESKAAAL